MASLFGAVVVLAAVLLVRNWSGDEARVEGASPANSASTSAPPPTTPEAEAPAPDPSTEGEGTEPDENDEDDAAGGGSTTVPPPPRIETIACPADIDLVICDAAEAVQQLRGRPFKVFPSVELLEEAEFNAVLLEDFDEEIPELEVDGQVLAALGLFDSEQSLADAFRDLLEVGVVGFYDPETDRLRVKAGELNLYAQLILVHELVHAIDDQWLELDLGDAEDDESGYGLSAVVEGNASRIEYRWRAGLDDEDRRELTAQEFALLTPDDIARYLAIPSVLIELISSPYTDGQVFVERLASLGGEEAVDEAFANPPTSSEEILHPGTDRLDDPEISVDTPPSAGEIIDEGRLGELLIRIWLGRVAAEGWGGDRYVAWTEGERSCISIDIAADSASDLDDVRSAAEQWALVQPEDRSVVDIVADVADLVRITGCA